MSASQRILVTDDDPETFRDFIDRISLDDLRVWSKIPEWTAPPLKVKREKVNLVFRTEYVLKTPPRQVTEKK
jgi:hypothetical protein